jgi:hypothetical protein
VSENERVKGEVVEFMRDFLGVPAEDQGDEQAVAKQEGGEPRGLHAEVAEYMDGVFGIDDEPETGG